MAVTNCYKVNWHRENSGKEVGNREVSYCQAADNKYDTLKAIIVTNQGANMGQATFVIDNVLNVGITGIGQ